MVVSFVYPSSHHRTGGVVVLYELANALARRSHEVHFLHGPAWPHRLGSLDDLPDVRFEDEVHHHIVDSLDEPGLPEGDVVFLRDAPARLGLPAVVVQGFRMLHSAWESEAFRARAPKVCVARWLIDVGRDFGVPIEQLWHVPVGMDHELFTFETPLDGRPVDVAMLHHVFPEKGWDVGFAALSEVHDRVPGLRSMVFGVEEPAEVLPDGARFLLAPDQRTLVDTVYNATKVFAQPSRHEGFGYTAVEAMACGAALVTTDNGGSRDYAVADETAVVVPTGDVAALADGIEALVRDDTRRTRLAKRGERFVRRFDWDRSGALLEEHLERYLADPESFQRASAED